MIHGSITTHSTQRHPHPYHPEGQQPADLFGSDANHAAFAEWLKEYSQKYHVDVHAWMMMTNHVHLLCDAPQRKWYQSNDAGSGRALRWIF
jgi:hypothetical protein